MSLIKNPGRVVGAWYLLLVFAGPLRLIYIPNKLFVEGNSAATASNIAAHPWLFRFGMVSLLFGAIVLIFLTLVAFVFWLGGLAEKSTFVAPGDREGAGGGGGRHVGH